MRANFGGFYPLIMGPSHVRLSVCVWWGGVGKGGEVGWGRGVRKGGEVGWGRGVRWGGEGG